MKRLSRFALRLLTAPFALFIAACYGVSASYANGRVIDSVTGAKLADILVDCLDDRDGVVDSLRTDDAGYFDFNESRCDKFSAKDEAVPTRYASKVVGAARYQETIIRLEPLD